MDIRTAFPSKYLKAADLQGEAANLTIRAVSVEDIGDDEARPIVFFDEARKGLVLNRTNATTIASLYGHETDGWRGKPITLFPSETAFRGSMVECLRIRSAAPEIVDEDPEDEEPAIIRKPRRGMPAAAAPAPVANGNGHGNGRGNGNGRHRNL